jgi:hypothetical protein
VPALAEVRACAAACAGDRDRRAAASRPRCARGSTTRRSNSAGAPLRVAYATAAAVVFTLEDRLLRAVVPGFEPPPWEDVTDWPALARAAGEEMDPEGWRRWAAERFPDPDPGPEP